MTTAGMAPTPPVTSDVEAGLTTVRRPIVALVGPRTESRGGVATTMRLLQNSRLSEEFDLVVVSTYRDAAVPGKALEAARGLARLARLCATGRVHLVHIHASSGASLARKSLGIAVAKAARVPVVLHMHGGGFGRENSGALGALQRRAIRWALECSDAVVAVTPGWEQSLAARGKLRRSRVIANAPDLAAQAHTVAAGERRVVLFLGHLYRDKGVYDVVDAFASEARPDFRLVLAGEGPEAQGLRQQVEELGLDSTVELPGWVGPEAKSELLANTACFVLPSRYEGLPLALLEAMLSGVPIVATKVGGVPEVVEDGRHALLVPPGDVGALAEALTCILNDPKLAARLSGAARERALAEYTPDAFVERIGDLYRDVLVSR